VREYLLYCTYCNEYTTLGKFLEKEGHFEGEYSLLHNRRLDSDDLLCRFLVRHVGHHLKTYPNRTDEYSDVLRTAERFMDGDVDAFVERQMERTQRLEGDLQMERGLGQLQMNVLKQLIAHEAETIAKLPTDTAAEAQFLLGKEEGLKRAIAIMQELMEKTNTLYR